MRNTPKAALIAFVALATPLIAVGNALAQIRINEVSFNPPGGDNGQEFFELLGTANASLNNVFFVVLEGDSGATGGGAGVVERAIDLTGFSLGSNGLFLQRDSSTVLDTSPDSGVQGPAPETTVRIADINPDIENNSNTFFLIQNFTSSIGTDLDANEDGVLDNMSFGTVLDGIGIKEGSGTEFTYASQVGGIDFPPFNFEPGSVVRLPDNSLVASVLTGSSPGPYQLDPNRTGRPDGQLVAPDMPYYLTPGVLNPNGNFTAVPEPGTMALLGAGVLPLYGAIRRRSRKAADKASRIVG